MVGGMATQEMIRGQSFGKHLQVSAQKSELQAKSRSSKPKVRVTAGETPRIRTESPEKETRIGVYFLLQKTPLKAFLNPPNVCRKVVTYFGPPPARIP